MTRAAAVVVLGILLCGCASDRIDAPVPETPLVRGIRVTPSFSADIQEIFSRRGCSTTGCHGATAVLPLTAGLSYAALVGAPATAEIATRVVPYDAAASYLMRRLDGTQAVGSRMPLGGAPLDSIDLTNIRRWIQQGARRN